MPSMIQELHDALADASGDPENYNQISTLVDIVMEFIAPNMEIRPGNLMELSVQVNFLFHVEFLVDTAGHLCMFLLCRRYAASICPPFAPST